MTQFEITEYTLGSRITFGGRTPLKLFLAVVLKNPRP
jgi:hypothetical protein